MSPTISDEKNKGLVGAMLKMFEKKSGNKINPTASGISGKGSSSMKMAPVKRYKVLHCLKSYIYRITDDDLILVDGKPVKGYLQSSDELPRSGVQYRYVTLEEDKVHRFRAEKKIMGYGEISGLLLKPTELALVDDIREFLRCPNLNSKTRNEFIAGLKVIIAEYHRGDAPEVPEVTRMKSTDTQKISSEMLTAVKSSIVP